MTCADSSVSLALCLFICKMTRLNHQMISELLFHPKNLSAPDAHHLNLPPPPAHPQSLLLHSSAELGRIWCAELFPLTLRIRMGCRCGIMNQPNISWNGFHSDIYVFYFN